MPEKKIKKCQCERPSGCHPETDQQGFWIACNDCGGMIDTTYERFGSYQKITQSCDCNADGL